MSEGRQEIPGDLSEILERQGLDPARLGEVLSAVHPVDLAFALDDVEIEDRARIFSTLDVERAARVLSAMPPEYRKEIVPHVEERRLASILDRLPDDEVADLVELLPPTLEKAVLSRVTRDMAEDVQELRQYPPHTAGGRMTKNFVTVPETFTAGETIRTIQGAVDQHTVDFVYVVDAKGSLRGLLTLPKLMIHKPDQPVAGFMRTEVMFVGPSADQEEVAQLAQKYKLRAVPVVGNDMKLLGVVTLQDIVEVIRHEADEDIMRLAGAQNIDPIRAPFLQRLRSRLPWLATAMALELLIAFIMKAYGTTLETSALAYFIPVIMAMGGSLGLQSSTIVVRGLATGDITLSRSFRVIVGEFQIGVVAGILAGLVTGGVALYLEAGTGGAAMLGTIVFISMLFSLCVASTMGALTPLVLQRMKLDPAVACGPFITAVNDVVNVTIYLSMAALLIARSGAA